MDVARLYSYMYYCMLYVSLKINRKCSVMSEVRLSGIDNRNFFTVIVDSMHISEAQPESYA